MTIFPRFQTIERALGPAFLLLAASCSTAFAQHQEERPRNIILMIGDGMGITQITAGLIKNGRKLNLERCTHVGLHKNFPAGGGLIVDSAAGATLS